MLELGEPGMQSALISRGADFIGQNLVHAWPPARPAGRLVIVDAMTNTTNTRNFELVIADRSILFNMCNTGDTELIRDCLAGIGRALGTEEARAEQTRTLEQHTYCHLNQELLGFAAQLRARQ
jgi:dTDP-D-glucose 4,6-dehydratase